MYKASVRFAYVCCLSLIAFSSALSAQTTADNLSWQHYKMPSEPSLRGSAIKGQTLWVTGSNNSVFVSQDGGASWQNKSVKSTLTLDFRDIELFDKNTAIVMGVGEGEQSRLYKTSDGGDSWHLLYENEFPNGFFDSIAFWDENSGLLMGDPIDGYYVIMRTSDGGKSWQRVPQNSLPNLLEKEAAFAASGNTLIVGAQGRAWLTTGGFSASIYSSDDYGNTWHRQSVPLYRKQQTAGGYGLGLNALGHLFVVGGDYQQRSAKYANMASMINSQWQQIESGRYGLRTAISCQKDICITTGKTGNDISFNHGKNWQVLPNEKAAPDDQGFFTLDSDNGVFLFAGHSGKVAILNVN